MESNDQQVYKRYLQWKMV